MSSSIVIEFEGFQISSDKFIIKELAFCAGDEIIGHWFFKPPHAFEALSRKKQIEYSWVSRNIHGIKWDFGHLPYAALYPILSYLFDKYSCIYTKGYQKRKFLEFLSARDCFDIKSLKIAELPIICPHHHRKHFQHCALHKAITLRKALIGDDF